MANQKYIIALDEGTTSARTLVIDKQGNIVASEQREFTQYFPNPGWVEHDATEIWNTQRTTLVTVMNKLHITGKDVDSIGITNQRETVVVWDKQTGLPIYNAIVWQDKRTTEYCEKLSKDTKLVNKVKEKTGLVLNPYFSATKIKWILDNVKDARKNINNLMAGTIDSWLMFKLSGGKIHATDKSNASRTMLFNITKGEWDEELLKLFDIPKSILPKVRASSEIYGDTFPGLLSRNDMHQMRIASAIGDQQSALFGQLCTDVGEVKNTYGTGCFALMNTGTKPVFSKNGLLTTIAWELNGKTYYALEGSVMVAGSAIQWLRDSLRMVYTSQEVEWYTNLVNKNDARIYVVPSFAGLGAPYWDNYSRGAIFGIERGTKREHLVKATVESLAYQSKDLIEAMQKDLGKKLKSIKVDGGASKNNYLMQFQAEVAYTEVIRPKNVETTAMGAAFMAGLATGFWKNISEIEKIAKVDHKFTPKLPKAEVEKLNRGWTAAVKRTFGWLKDIE